MDLNHTEIHLQAFIDYLVCLNDYLSRYTAKILQKFRLPCIRYRKSFCCGEIRQASKLSMLNNVHLFYGYISSSHHKSDLCILGYSMHRNKYIIQPFYYTKS